MIYIAGKQFPKTENKYLMSLYVSSSKSQDYVIAKFELYARKGRLKKLNNEQKDNLKRILKEEWLENITGIYGTKHAWMQL
ncbi:hypothetical protein TNCV_2922011 [Trichonephila clavipes]|nr:hypothetical protein TNCV_2922011 [Trichonephila clavipes]